MTTAVAAVLLVSTVTCCCLFSVRGDSCLNDFINDMGREPLGKLEVIPQKEINPNKAYYYQVGDNVNITCTLNEDHVTPNSSLVLAHDCLPVQQGRLVAPSATSLVLPLTSASVGDSGYYRCARLRDSAPVGKLTVFFGYGPEEPVMQCRAVDWVRLECNWSAPPLPEQNAEMGPTVWTVKFASIYISSNATQDSVVCSQDESNATSCVCLGSSGPVWTFPFNASTLITCSFGGLLFGEFQNYHFNVTAGNKLATRLWTYTVKANQSIVEFQLPLENLQVAPLSSTELQVTWSVPSASVPEYTKPCYELTYWRSDQPAVVKNVSIESSRNSSLSLQLPDLHPASLYQMALRWRLQNSSYWSPQNPASGATPEDVPWGAVGTTPGAYSPCLGSATCVVVNWKPMDPVLQNGQIVSYSIVTTACQDGGQQQEVTHHVIDDGNVTSALLNSLPPLSCRHVSIRAATRAGNATKAAYVNVFHPHLGLETPDAVYAEAVSNGSYLVTWSPQTDDVTRGSANVTVFWCQGTDGALTSVDCKSSIEWVITTSKEVEVTPDPTKVIADPGTRWRFGVAWVKDGRSAGITWDRCLYVRGKTDAAPPRIALQETEDRHVRVLLGFSDCDLTYIQGRPLAYQVLYSPLQPQENFTCGKGRTVSQSAGPGVLGVSVGGLEAGATYGFCLRVVTTTGSGRFSEPAILQLSQPDKSLGLDVGVSVATVVVFLLLIIFTLCLRKWRHKKTFDINTDFMTGTHGIANDVYQELWNGLDIPSVGRDPVTGQSTVPLSPAGILNQSRDCSSPPTLAGQSSRPARSTAHSRRMNTGPDLCPNPSVEAGAAPYKLDTSMAYCTLATSTATPEISLSGASHPEEGGGGLPRLGVSTEAAASPRDQVVFLEPTDIESAGDRSDGKASFPVGEGHPDTTRYWRHDEVLTDSRFSMAAYVKSDLVQADESLSTVQDVRLGSGDGEVEVASDETSSQSSYICQGDFESMQERSLEERNSGYVYAADDLTRQAPNLFPTSMQEIQHWRLEGNLQESDVVRERLFVKAVNTSTRQSGGLVQVLTDTHNDFHQSSTVSSTGGELSDSDYVVQYSASDFGDPVTSSDPSCHSQSSINIHMHHLPKKEKSVAVIKSSSHPDKPSVQLNRFDREIKHLQIEMHRFQRDSDSQLILSQNRDAPRGVDTRNSDVVELRPLTLVNNDRPLCISQHNNKENIPEVTSTNADFDKDKISDSADSGVDTDTGASMPGTPNELPGSTVQASTPLIHPGTAPSAQNGYVSYHAH